MSQLDIKSDEGTIDIVYEGAIAIITLNRPKVRNAINLAAAHRLSELVDDIESRDDVQVGIITAAGGVAFSAGADLRARAAGEPRASLPGSGFAGFVRRKRKKPFVAAVNGYAVGGGLEIAMSCELVVASPNARFSLPEPLRGLIAGGDCLPIALRRLPLSLAWELALTGRQLTADEALRVNMINAVDEDCLGAARRFASAIAANAPLAVQATMELMQSLPHLDRPAYDQLTEATQKRLMATNDAKEGSSAFLEKRAPQWTGS